MGNHGWGDQMWERERVGGVKEDPKFLAGEIEERKHPLEQGAKVFESHLCPGGS